MTAQEYIQQRLAGLSEPARSSSVSGKASDVALYDQVYAKLMSKKFRKLKATQDCQEVVERVVKQAIKTKAPITISLLFGGNKLWSLEEAPQIDWAELFNLFYYIDWAKSIAAVHPPGVVIDYYSQDVSVESLNNVPREQTDQYSQTFREMIAFIKPYLPKNVSITYRRHLEEFADPADYYKELEEGKLAVLKDNNGELPVLDEAMRSATELNVRLKPGQDADPKWREKVELEHQAIFRTKTLGKYLSDANIITLCPTNYEHSNSIITGSTKRSYAKFWAGVGALGKVDQKYSELVLTPKQLEVAQFDWQEVLIKGLPGKNFSKVRVLR